GRDRGAEVRSGSGGTDGRQLRDPGVPGGAPQRDAGRRSQPGVRARRPAARSHRRAERPADRGAAGQETPRAETLSANLTAGASQATVGAPSRDPALSGADNVVRGLPMTDLGRTLIVFLLLASGWSERQALAARSVTTPNAARFANTEIY